MSEQVFGGVHQTGRPARPLLQSMARGFRGRCPRCGEGRLFSGFLTVAAGCKACGEAMHHHRADDLPAYLVVLVVGHIVVGAFLGIEAATTLSMVQHLVIWVPLTILLALGLLRPIKGAVVGLQWALYMHGFGGEDDRVEPLPEG